MKKFFLVLWTVLSAGFFASAQDEGLYAPAPPPDAAFVRVLHAVEGGKVQEPRIGDVSFGPLAYTEVSPYEVALQGTHEVTAGGLSERLELSAGRFYTVALTGDGIALFEDPTSQNRARALLLLYNLTDGEVELKTADGSTDVIPATPPGEVGSVEVNPIVVAFGVFAGGAPRATFDEVQLERGAAYSAFALGGTPPAVFVRSTTSVAEE